MATDPLIQHCTNAKLRQLMRQVNQHFDAEVAQSGLKTTQYSLLNYVLRLGPVRPVDLANAMRMTASTLSRSLQPLLTAGWIEIGAGADARSHLVTITEAGRAKQIESRRYWKQAQQKLNARLSPERVQALHALIDESLALLSADALAEHDA